MDLKPVWDLVEIVLANPTDKAGRLQWKTEDICFIINVHSTNYVKTCYLAWYKDNGVINKTQNKNPIVNFKIVKFPQESCMITSTESHSNWQIQVQTTCVKFALVT